MTTSPKILLLIAVLFGVNGIASAQVTSGTPPFGSFGGGSNYSINLANLNATVAFPLFGTNGRGIPFFYNFTYNTSIWSPHSSSGTSVWTPVSNFGFDAGIPAWVGSIAYSATSGCSGYPPYQVCWSSTSNYTYTDTSSTVHPFSYYYYCVNGQCSASGSGVASDGSGYTICGASGSCVIDRTGRVINTGSSNLGTAASIEDTNGNYLSANPSGSNYVMTDTLGQTVLTIGTMNQYGVVTYTLPTGTASVYMQKYTVRTHFGCSGVAEYGPTSQWLPFQINLPDGTVYYIAYEITPGYNSDVTGRPARVSVADGGEIDFFYNGANSGINCSDGSTPGFSVNTTDGTWTYARNGSTTTVTAPKLSYDPIGNDTVYSFDTTGHELSHKVYQGSQASGALLRTVNTTWSGGTPATTVTILEDGMTQSESDTTYDAYGNLLGVTEYDWGNGSHGAMLRATNYTYASNVSIPNLLTDVVIQDGTGTAKYRKHIGYDENMLGNCPTGVTHHDDSGHGCSFTNRGNVTSVTVYQDPVTPSLPISRSSTYDVFGNTLTAQLNCCQLKTWAFSTLTSYAFPDSVTSGTGSIQLTTGYTYQPGTDLVKTITDPNGQVTTNAYDSNKRLTSVTFPDSAQTQYSYSGATTVTTKTPIDSSHSLSNVMTYDNFGRPYTTTEEDANSTIYSIISYQYDALGRLSATSNPYVGASPSYWTTSQFDALGRQTKTILPDGELVTYSYSLQSASVTDPAGQSRKGKADAAARLVAAYEPDVTNGNSLTQETDYSYDVLDDLTTVSQGQQTRSYIYDALGRLVSAATPEANGVATTFAYDSFDNLISRTDPRGVVSNYSYDGLNRMTGISYPSVPAGVSPMPNNICDPTGGTNKTANVCFYYGQGGAAAFALGRLTQMVDSSGSETTSYDNMGRTAQVQKIVGVINFTTQYQYNLANQLTQLTYPSGRQVKPTYDAVGRAATVADTMGGVNTTYASGFAYNTAQQMTGVTYGNGVTAALTYSPDRLQLASLAYAKGTSTYFSASYSYTQNAGNNGQITGVTDNVANGRSPTYAYDALGRLINATTSGDANYAKWGLSETYDRYGNRTTQTVTAGSAPPNAVVVSPTTNHITTSGYNYDANGNLTNDAQNVLTYDGESRLTGSSGSFGTGAYVYDGNGIRVEKIAGGTTTAYIFSGPKVIAEYSLAGFTSTLQREYVYSTGTLIAKIEAGATQYYHADQLSVRAMTDSSGNLIGEQGNFPFGEQWYAKNTTTKWQFSSYESDSESGNDYATAREYVSRLARFSTLDPVSGTVADPQSLSRYAYVVNDPITQADATGRDYVECTEDSDSAGCDPICSETFCGGGVPNEDPPSEDLSLLFGVDASNVLKSTTIAFLPAGNVLCDPSADWGCELTYDSFASGGGGGGKETTPQGAAGGGVNKAKLIILKPDCVKFLQKLFYDVYNNRAGGNLSPEEQDFATGMGPNAGLNPGDYPGGPNTGLTVVQTLGETSYSASSSDPTNGGFETDADTLTWSRSVTLYSAYKGMGATDQGQVLIHEAVHDSFGFTDREMGQAVTGNIYADTQDGRDKASSDFQKALKQHCK
jgi:RHS repeat-associated protein